MSINVIPTNNPLNTVLQDPVGLQRIPRDPNQFDDTFEVGDEWQNTLTGTFWKCQSAAINNAVWINLSAGGGTGTVSSITGNDSVAVLPNGGGNIFINGSGSITTLGSTNTLTVELTGLTNHNVLVGSGGVTVTNVPPSSTTGLALVSQGASSDPVFGIVSPAGGGTGTNTLTGVITGNGSSAMTASLLTQHDVLVGAASNLITSVAPSATSGVPLVSQGAAADPHFGTAVVAGEGTGQTTLTNHGVLLGQGTSAVGAVAPGTAGLPLVAQGASADPSYAVLGISGGGTNQTSMTTWGVNYFDGTSVNTTGAGTAGYVLTSNATSAPTFQPLGTVTPVAFLAYIDPAVANATGDGTSVTVPFNTVQYDVSTNYNNSTYAFTAPIDGYYRFSTAVQLSSVGAGHTLGTIFYTVNGTGNFYTQDSNPAAGADPSGNYTLQGSALLKLNAADTVQVVVTVSNSTKTVGLFGSGSTNLYSFFCGDVDEAGLPFTIPINVPTGGTGNNTLTNHAVLIGAGTSPINTTGPGAAGYVLTSNGAGADPTFQPATAGLGTLTDGSANVVSPTGGTITFVNGNNISNLSGSTSHITFSVTGTTNHAIQLGNSSGSLSSLALGTSGQALISAGAGSDPAFGTLTVPGGGTGATTLTGVLIGNGTSAITGNAIVQYNVLVGGASNAITSIAPNTSGYVLTSNGASANPTFQALPNPASFTWNSVAGTSQTLATLNGYVNQNAGLTTFTLPGTASFGDVFAIAGVGAGGWTIAQGSGQSIIVGTATSTTGLAGSVSSTLASDTIYLLCVTANTTFKAFQWAGNLTVV